MASASRMAPCGCASLVVGEVEAELEVRVEREDGDAVLRLERVEQLVGVAEDLHLPADADRARARSRSGRRRPGDVPAAPESRATSWLASTACSIVRQLARRGGLRDPLDRLDLRRLAVDVHAEVLGSRFGDRIAAVVGDAGVDEDALDGDRLLASAPAASCREQTQEQKAAKHRRSAAAYNPRSCSLRSPDASILLATLLFASSAFAARFDELFLDKTMRVDYFHTGNHGEEIVALDRVVTDGPWPGSRTHLVDTTNLGNYYFEVVDRETNQVALLARLRVGFRGVGDDRRGEAARRHVPRVGALPVAAQAGAGGAQEARQGERLSADLVDARSTRSSRFVNKADLQAARQGLDDVRERPGLGEGRPAGHRRGLHRGRADEVPQGRAAAGGEALRRPSRSSRSKKDFNVRAIDLPAAQSGVHRPRTSDDRRTAISTEYNIFDSERYVLTLDNRALRDVASAAPYDFLEILVNEKQYGGGGIFNDQATAAVDSRLRGVRLRPRVRPSLRRPRRRVLHVATSRTRPAGENPEPWEPNLTARRRASEVVRPGRQGRPLPTPWDKEGFEEHSREHPGAAPRAARGEPPGVGDGRALPRGAGWETKFLDHDQKYAGKVGAFEGAGYEAKGLYRPQVDCIMFTRDEVGFCRVCQRAISRIIDIYSH